jgi:hypothetical protein
MMGDKAEAGRRLRRCGVWWRAAAAGKRQKEWTSNNPQ